MRRRTFTVLPLADKVIGCARCGRKCRTGERVTSYLQPSSVEFRHAGRKCPPAVVDRHPFIRTTKGAPRA